MPQALSSMVHPSTVDKTSKAKTEALPGDDKAPSLKMDPSLTRDGNKAVRGLLRLLSKYSSDEDEGLIRLLEIDNENEKLKAENKSLRTTNDVNLQSFLSYRDKWKAAEKEYEETLKEERDRADQELQKKKEVNKALNAERHETDTLRGQLADQDKRLIRLVETVKKNEEEVTRLGNTNKERGLKLGQEMKERKRLEADMNTQAKQLEAKSQELAAKNNTLGVFRAFIAPLTPLHKRRGQIREALTDMLNGAMDYLQRTIGRDLADDLLLKSNTKSHAREMNPLPFPPSNSQAAKHMRVVAGLTALGTALATYVFRPTYVVEDHELDDALQSTANQSPVQEAYVRAVLLRALPEKQKRIQEEGISLAAQAVTEAVGCWLQNEGTFASGLKEVCERAGTTWALVQRVEERIWPEFDFEMAEGWASLPVVASVGQSAQVSSGRVANELQEATPGGSLDSDVLSGGEVAGVVWPAFIAVEFPDEESAELPPFDLVQPGYVLTRSQVKAAEHEISESSQRFTRKLARRFSSATARRRRDSAVFLTNGSSSELETK